MLSKIQIHQACLEHVNSRLENMTGQMRQFQLASNEDTKSSMGDKYETSREMINYEKGKVAGQLNEMAKLKATLDGIDPERFFDKVQLGSLIETNHGLIYISVGLGQLKVEEENVIVISAVSPLGQQLLDKKKGDAVSFGPRSYELVSVQ
ncbi:MAG: transcription elongation GreA/GreB family factor [Cyclobacteriaceae bacterium]|jgi:transcription elongation GreA/GreB family factor